MQSPNVLVHFHEIARTMIRLAESRAEVIERAIAAVTAAVGNGHKILLFGNGGSAADAQHIAAEFVGRFRRERQAWPALALTANTSTLTAIGNDYGFDMVFARQVQALGSPGDVAIGISTSGRSTNVVTAIDAAAQAGMTTIGLTGGDGGLLAQRVNIAIVVPSNDTARIQECHIAIGHYLCEAVEAAMVNVK
jgi:D-sedoheptulose 7-phosphate isomerase